MYTKAQVNVDVTVTLKEIIPAAEIAIQAEESERTAFWYLPNHLVYMGEKKIILSDGRIVLVERTRKYSPFVS